MMSHTVARVKSVKTPFSLFLRLLPTRARRKHMRQLELGVDDLSPRQRITELEKHLDKIRTAG